MHQSVPPSQPRTAHLPFNHPFTDNPMTTDECNPFGSPPRPLALCRSARCCDTPSTAQPGPGIPATVLDVTCPPLTTTTDIDARVSAYDTTRNGTRTLVQERLKFCGEIRCARQPQVAIVFGVLVGASRAVRLVRSLEIARSNS